jgi:glycosidase
MNHTSDQHTWFTQSNNNTGGYRDWYRWEDRIRVELVHGIKLFGTSAMAIIIMVFFGGGMPDLNYTHEAVKTEMFDIASFWLERYECRRFPSGCCKIYY